MFYFVVQKVDDQKKYVWKLGLIKEHLPVTIDLSICIWLRPINLYDKQKKTSGTVI